MDSFTNDLSMDGFVHHLNIIRHLEMTATISYPALADAHFRFLTWLSRLKKHCFVQREDENNVIEQCSPAFRRSSVQTCIDHGIPVPDCLSVAALETTLRSEDNGNLLYESLHAVHWITRLQYDWRTQIFRRERIALDPLRLWIALRQNRRSAFRDMCRFRESCIMRNIRFLDKKNN